MSVRSLATDLRGGRIVKQVARLQALVILSLLFARESRSQGIGEPLYVGFTANAPGLPIVSAGRAAPILVSADDWPGVVRVAGDLRDDIQRVSGATPTVLHAEADARKTTPILLGTIGHSSLIDDLIRRHKLDVSGVEGHWEICRDHHRGEAISRSASRARSCRGRQAWHHLRRL